MRCMLPLVMLVLLAVFALSGYNYYQIRELKAELQNANPTATSQVTVSKAEQDITNLLSSVKQQTDQAKQLLAAGHAERARVMLTQCVGKLEQASKLSQQIADSAAQKVKDAVSSAQKAVDGTMKETTKNHRGH